MDERRLDQKQVQEIVERFNATRIAVLGDVMLDRYFWGEVDRISPEAPVPVVRVNRRSERLGGAANVAANLRALGVGVDIAGVVGNDRAAESVTRMLKELGVGTEQLVVEDGHETTEKVRIIARNQQVVRADFEEDAKDNLGLARKVIAAGLATVEGADALVISDYGKGVFSEATLREIIPAWRSLGKPVLVDPHIPHFGWYRGATIATPNTREASAATGLPFDRGVVAGADVSTVLTEQQLDALLVTRGEHGMSLYSSGGEEVHIPTVAKEVYDVTGAGDTVISVLSACLAAGVDLVDAVVMANQGAGEVVREVGTTTLSREALVGAFK